MQKIEQFKANSGKVYDTEVEAEIDDTTCWLREQLIQYCSTQSDEQNAAIENVLSMLTKNEDWSMLMIEKIEAYHQLVHQRDGTSY